MEGGGAAVEVRRGRASSLPALSGNQDLTSIKVIGSPCFVYLPHRQTMHMLRARACASCVRVCVCVRVCLSIGAAVGGGVWALGFGRWCVVCGVWCVVCGVWCVVCGV